MYEIARPTGEPWRSGLDTAGAAYRLLAAAPPGCVVRRERDGVRVGPRGELVADPCHLVAVLAALPGNEADIAVETGMPADVVMASLAALRAQGRAAWDGWRWVALG